MKNRANKILELLTLSPENKMEVTALAEKLQVSQVTIRKDLDALENKGIIKREHGIALLCSTTTAIFNHDSIAIFYEFGSFLSDFAFFFIMISYSAIDVIGAT